MNPHLLVQSLQGARAQILFAFLFAGHAMDVEELSTWTGKMRQTHYGHLGALCSAGLLAKQRIAQRDIYLLGSEMLPALQAWVAQIGSGATLLDAGDPEIQESRIMTPGSPATTTNGRRKSDKSRVVVEAGQESRIMTPAGYENRKALELRQANEDRQKLLEDYGIPVGRNLKACKLFGIGEPMATTISEMKHVTPEFIEAHIRSLGPGETKGLAIVRIKSDETPRLWDENNDDESGDGTTKKTRMSIDGFRGVSPEREEDEL